LAYDAFLIAQEAARHSPLTLKWYTQRLGRFLEFLVEGGTTAPEDITAPECRAFFVELGRCKLKDTTVQGYAQAVKPSCRFLEREGFAPRNAMATVRMTCPWLMTGSSAALLLYSALTDYQPLRVAEPM